MTLLSRDPVSELNKDIRHEDKKDGLLIDAGLTTTLQNTADLLRGIIEPRAILPRNPWHARRKRHSSPKAALEKDGMLCTHHAIRAMLAEWSLHGCRGGQVLIFGALRLFN